MTDITANSQTEVTFDYLRSLLDKELTFIEPNYYCTIRGLCRLLSLQSPASLIDKRLNKTTQKPRGILARVAACMCEELPDSLKPVAGFDYSALTQNTNANTNTALLPDTVIACVRKQD